MSDTTRFQFLTVLTCALCVATVSNVATAQSDARQRQAAAEAYDQGTASYLSGDYTKAAEWFETAHRMAPAAAALVQAARAHEKAGNLPRAATLGLRLTVDFPDDPAAPIGQGIIDQHAGQLVRIDVMCSECSLDLDGTLQEFHSFFLEPESTHVLVAGFETGERSEEISGSAGEVRSVEFSAPPHSAPPDDPKDPEPIVDSPQNEPVDRDGKPFSPIFTYVGLGITGALLIGSIITTADTLSSANDYEKAAKASNDCALNCDVLYEAADKLLEDGQSKETLTTVLWLATGVAAAGTAVIALALTDWSDDASRSRNESGRGLALRVWSDPTKASALATLEGRF